jgi:anti-anti-sigma factor
VSASQTPDRSTVWRAEYFFRIDVDTDDSGGPMSVSFHGDLDALSARLLQRAAPIDIGEATSVVLDLKNLAFVDISGVREIRRIAQHIRAAGREVVILGATPDVQQMLDLPGSTVVS